MQVAITGGEPNPQWENYNFEEEYDTETPHGKLRIAKENPFGFRRLVLERGEVPSKYSSAYTGIYQAREAKDQLIEELKNAQEAINGRSAEVPEGLRQDGKPSK